jgi:hypothetical protein
MGAGVLVAAFDFEDLGTGINPVSRFLSFELVVQLDGSRKRPMVIQDRDDVGFHDFDSMMSFWMTANSDKSSVDPWTSAFASSG